MHVTIFQNAMDPLCNRETVTTDDLLECLADRFEVFPENAKIYKDHVCQQCEVTPRTEADIDALSKMDGHFFVLVYPGTGVEIAIIIAIVLAASAIALNFLFKPNSKKDNSDGSPNNELSNRENRARPNDRIPDIYGEVRAVPDLICPPYRFFVSNQEIEDCAMCVGRGAFAFKQTTVDSLGNPLPTALWDIKDDVTPVQQEGGASVEVWAPFTSPNPKTGGVQNYTPQLRIGSAINTPMNVVQACSAVVGQILRPPNDQSIASNNNNMHADSGGVIYVDGTQDNGATIDLTQYFAVGDTIHLAYPGADDPGANQASVDLSGTYTVLALTATTLTLSNPAAVNANWTAVASFTGAVTKADNLTITSSGNRWVGPFVLNVANMTEVWCNFVAPNGIFKVSSSSGNQYRIDIQVTIGIQSLDAYQRPIGNEVYYNVACTGSNVLKNQRAVTAKCVLPLPGPCRIRVVRTNLTDNTWKGTNSDQLQWRDCYSVVPATNDNYGNVTLVQTRTYATPSATASKSRKFNALVTRQLTARDRTDGTATGSTFSSVNAGDIIIDMALDPFVGNRTLAEVDVLGIHAALDESGTIATYFGTKHCVHFGYTFDDKSTSFEEMLSDVQQATFCTLFRRGSLLKCNPELLETQATILFNHRNKIPGTESRSFNFGWANDFDGIQLTYVDPNAPNAPNVETQVVLNFPDDQSAIKPKQITAYGVRNNVQAHFLGARMFNKLKYQCEQVEFTTTKQAALCVLNERIMVTDETRADVITGQITAVNALRMTLSQSCDLTVIAPYTYTMFLQDPNGVVEGIPVMQLIAGNDVYLQRAPMNVISTDINNWMPTIYNIAIPQQNNDIPAAMMLAEKKNADHQQYTIKAVNYDPRYYGNDTDYKNGLISLNTGLAVNAGYAAPGTVSPPVVTTTTVPAVNTVYSNFETSANWTTASNGTTGGSTGSSKPTSGANQSNPTIRSLLFAGCTSRLVAHLMIWFTGNGKHTVDPSRAPGYSQLSSADVTAHCQRIKAQGYDDVTPNCYGLSSAEHPALLQYLPALQAAGLGLIINIDKGAYPNGIADIRSYMTFLRSSGGPFSYSNYRKFGGKYIITYFTVSTDDPAMFAQIESENTDCIFVYNDPNMAPLLTGTGANSNSKNVFSWVNSTLAAGSLRTWLTKYSTRIAGQLTMPCVFPGFDDTYIRKVVTATGKKGPYVASTTGTNTPTSVWPNSDGSYSVARVWPPGVPGPGPNASTLASCFTEINAKYSTSNQPDYIQFVTLNDWDEGSALEPTPNGEPGFFADAPVSPTGNFVYTPAVAVGNSGTFAAAGTYPYNNGAWTLVMGSSEFNSCSAFKVEFQVAFPTTAAKTASQAFEFGLSQNQNDLLYIWRMQVNFKTSGKIRTYDNGAGAWNDTTVTSPTFTAGTYVSFSANFKRETDNSITHVDFTINGTTTTLNRNSAGKGVVVDDDSLKLLFSLDSDGTSPTPDPYSMLIKNVNVTTTVPSYTYTTTTPGGIIANPPISSANNDPALPPSGPIPF